MRVALDEQIFAIQPYGGISRMFAELASQFVDGEVGDVQLVPFNAPVVNRYVLDSPRVRSSLGASEARNQWTALAGYFARRPRFAEVEVVHSTFYLPHGLASPKSVKRVVTIHDMIPELMPQTRRRLDFLTLKSRYVRSADHIICVSESTKQDLLKVYGLTEAPISVVHHGVHSRFHPDVPRLDYLPERYLLFVGNRNQYKDADVLFRAFEIIAQTDLDTHLVCIGGSGLSQDEVDNLEAMRIRDRVSQRLLSDQDMISAYAHAAAFVFPSHFEGFGLPALEAMACGAPTILARATSLPEVGGDAALYFEPGDARDLARSISEVLRDPATSQDLRGWGLARAAEFTWQRAARETAEVYRSVLG